MRFLEFQTKTYKVNDYNRYINKALENGEDIPEEDKWKTLVHDESDVEPPEALISRVYIDPLDIVTFQEVFSLEQAFNDEEVVFDCVEVIMKNAPAIVVICTIDEFIKKISKFKKSNDA